MDHLDQLEQQSVYIFPGSFPPLRAPLHVVVHRQGLHVLLWLARKAFFGHVPFPLVHIDTSYKLPEMIQYRDRLALEYKLHMVVGQNTEALAAATPSRTSSKPSPT
jgi:sulfate adenylyltransferase subunit 2